MDSPSNTDENLVDSNENAKPIDIVVDMCKQLYGDRLLVIKEQGCFAYVLKMKLRQGVSANVNITDVDTLMEVFLSAPTLPDSFKAQFHRAVVDLKTIDSLPECLEAINNWYENHRDEIESQLNEASKPDKIKRSEQRKFEKKKKAMSEAEASGSAHQGEHEPLPRGMKPARDVISRILWDPDFPKKHFIVGYLDRFVGILEKPVMDLDWHNFGEVDPETLAVPEHRIQYFKYRELKVWDRPARLDLIFSSTVIPVDGPQNIYEAIEQQDTIHGTPMPSEPEVEDRKSLPEEASSSEEDYDTLQETSQFVNHDMPSGPSRDIPRGRRPTHYVSLKINDNTLKAKLREVQKSLFEQVSSNLIKTEDSLRAIEHLHVTLCLFDVGNDEEKFSAIRQSLHQLTDEALSIINGECLQFEGLAYLPQYRVVIAKLKPDQGFVKHLDSCLTNKFMTEGIEHFVPDRMHVTLMKVRPTSKQEGQASELELSFKRVGKAHITTELWAQDNVSSNENVDEDIVGFSDRLVGIHVKNAYDMGGYHNAILNAASVGSKSVAFFLSDKAKFEMTKMPSQQEADEFSKTCEQCDINPANVVVHGPYVLAPGDIREEIREQTIDQMVQDVRICDKLNIGHYNIHVDTHRAQSEPEIPAEAPTAFRNRVAESLQKVLDKTTNCATKILIETAAGQNGERGAKFHELREILDLIGHEDRMGVCVDTCHIFAAGYDIRTVEKFAKVMRMIEGQIGWSRVKALHLNDSKHGCGCLQDRHEIIGTGKIGTTAFEFIMNDPRFHNLPLILETPVLSDNHVHEVQKLHAMVRKNNRNLESKKGSDFVSPKSHPSTSQHIDEQSIIEYFESTKLNDQSRESRLNLTRKLESVARTCFSEDTRLHVIGGVASGLATNESDLDLCLMVPTASQPSIEPTYDNAWQHTVDLLRAFETCLCSRYRRDNEYIITKTEMRLGYVAVLRLSIEIIDGAASYTIDVDVSAQQEYSLHDTKLLSYYTKMDQRFAPLCAYLKKVVSESGINDAKDGFLNNYTYVLGLTHYLQAEVVPPVLPNILTEHPALFKSTSAFLDELPLELTRWHSTNKLNLLELWRGFVVFFIHFPLENFKISPVSGGILEKTSTEKEGKQLLILEDPFERRNTARALVDREKWEEIVVKLEESIRC